MTSQDKNFGKIRKTVQLTQGWRMDLKYWIMLAQATSKITPAETCVWNGECKNGPATVQLSALLFSPILWWREPVKSDWKWFCRGDQAIASAVCARRYAISAAHLSSPFQWLPRCPQISRPMRPGSQSAHAARRQPRDLGSACLASPLPRLQRLSPSPSTPILTASIQSDSDEWAC